MNLTIFAWYVGGWWRLIETENITADKYGFNANTWAYQTASVAHSINNDIKYFNQIAFIRENYEDVVSASYILFNWGRKSINVYDTSQLILYSRINGFKLGFVYSGFRRINYSEIRYTEVWSLTFQITNINGVYNTRSINIRNYAVDNLFAIRQNSGNDYFILAGQNYGLLSISIYLVSFQYNQTAITYSKENLDFYPVEFSYAYSIVWPQDSWCILFIDSIWIFKVNDFSTLAFKEKISYSRFGIEPQSGNSYFVCTDPSDSNNVLLIIIKHNDIALQKVLHWTNGIVDSSGNLLNPVDETDQYSFLNNTFNSSYLFYQIKMNSGFSRMIVLGRTGSVQKYVYNPYKIHYFQKENNVWKNYDSYTSYIDPDQLWNKYKVKCGTHTDEEWYCFSIKDTYLNLYPGVIDEEPGDSQKILYTYTLWEND